MKASPKLAFLAAATLLLAACTDKPMQSGGTVLGGIGGAIAGAQFGGGKGRLLATAIGAALGAFAGSELGKVLDDADRKKAAEAEKQAFESPVGRKVSWSNPDTGHSGSTTTLGEQVADSGICRDFQTTVNANGKTEQVKGFACRQPDGSWRVTD